MKPRSNQKKPRGWRLILSLLGGFLIGSIPWFLETGGAELIKEWFQKRHDKLNVVVEYDGGRQLNVLESKVMKNDNPFASEIRPQLLHMEDTWCRPELHAPYQISYRRDCASSIAGEVRQFLTKLPPNDARVPKLQKLLAELTMLERRPPDGVFLEVTARVTNYGEEVGRLDENAMLRAGDKKLSLTAVPGDDREVGGKSKYILPRFVKNFVPLPDWAEIESGVSRAQLVLTIRDRDTPYEKEVPVTSPFAQ